ncbi:hypothetical protein RRG08_056110 [Elysia crispata]|uniref:Uncharacterized protein n=1 Tax=Elysia crispata TaxID=231223 RepID=A0AAE0ZD00_9GAST|nr:hypothetical protein RRG08_056110 [Elysia crispata]
MKHSQRSVRLSPRNPMLESGLTLPSRDMYRGVGTGKEFPALLNECIWLISEFHQNSTGQHNLQGSLQGCDTEVSVME